MEKILVIETGGTFATSSVDGVRSLEHAEKSIYDYQIVKERLYRFDYEFEIQRPIYTLSENMTFEKLNMLIDELYKIDYSKYRGVIIIHGTDTLAYTSSMLSFMLPNISIPVIVTGSQLSISHPVADALENCRCAIYMAACGYPGVFVAFNRKVMLGCRASKVRSLSFDAFDSINYPNVAEISSLGLHVNRDALKVPTGDFKLEPDYSEEVFLLKLYPGIKAKIILKLYQQGYRGIYIEGYGLGGVPFLKHDFITAISQVTEKGMIVVIGSQCRYEGSNLSVYETGRLAVESGALEAYDMTSEAAITKLMWTLGQTGDADEVRKYFSRNMVGEVHIPTTIK